MATPSNLNEMPPRFEPVAGGVRMTDRVTHTLPFVPLGAPTHRLFACQRLAQIFAYRKVKASALFSA